MSGQRESVIQRLAFGRDPLDDPLNASWDAVVSDDRTVSPDANPDDVAFLRRVHTLETVSWPSSSFIGELEQRLVGLPPTPVARPKPTHPANEFELGTCQRSPTRATTIRTTNRWLSIQSAAAVLAVVMVASLALLYRFAPGPSEQTAIPAAVIANPEIETFAQFEFVPPMWGMPDASAWTDMQIGLFEVAPATSFSTLVTLYNSLDGPLSLTALSGELTVTPAGPAVRFSARQPQQAAVEVLAGDTVSIGLNETIVFSAKDGATASNLETMSALALYSFAGPFVTKSPGSIPNEVAFVVLEGTYLMPSVPTNSATLTVQRLELAPFDTFVFEPDPGLRYLTAIDPVMTSGLRIDEGAAEGIVPQPGAKRVFGSVSLRYLQPGPHTIFNIGDETVSIYFLVVEPLPDEAAPAT